MKKPVLKYKSVILSDVHLGTPDCKIDEVNHFLKHTRCERLILNGDIIDGWSLKRRLSWEKGHTKFIRRVLKIAEKKDTDVIYIRGNHDDFLANYLPLVFDRIQLVEEYVLSTAKGNYLCIHGDCFDAVTTHSKFISILGDIGYQSLLKFNRYYTSTVPCAARSTSPSARRSRPRSKTSSTTSAISRNTLKPSPASVSVWASSAVTFIPPKIR